MHCGSKSTLSCTRKQNTASNLEEHVSGKDIVHLLRLYGSPAFAEVLILIIENVIDFDCEDDFSLGEQLRQMLSARGVASVSNVQKGMENGGPTRRHRFYEAENTMSQQTGLRKLFVIQI